MKIINVLFLIFLSISIFAQNVLDSKGLIEKVFLSLPDTVMSTSFFDLPIAKRKKLLVVDNDEMTKNNNTGVSLFISEKENKAIILDPHSDASPKLVIKIFNDKPNVHVAITFSYYDGATTSSEGISFYDYNKSRILDITNKVLDGFNYFTDNYTDTTINLLNKYWETNLREGSGPCMSLIYDFTNSDTIEISDSFFGYFYDENPNPGLDTTYFDGEFYTKKYIMDNGKLRLAE